MHGLEKTHGAFFSKPCTKLTLHCNHRSGHLKSEHTESLYLLRRHFGNWPRSKHDKRTAGSAWETWTVAADDGVRCARVRWEIKFLLTFETAPLFCVYPVYPTDNGQQATLKLGVWSRNQCHLRYWSSKRAPSCFMTTSSIVLLMLIHNDKGSNRHTIHKYTRALTFTVFNP